MKLGEIGLLTNDVVRLADFYKVLLETENNSSDSVHQTIISYDNCSISLTIYNDGTLKNNDNRNMCIAFTVDDIEKEYGKLLKMGVVIIEKPTKRPWGATNLSFNDPDGNIVYLRQYITSLFLRNG